MKRRYVRELYKNRVEQVKKMIPHACIGVDVIVGFPGETDKDFKDTYSFINGLDISYLHVFTFSERSGTDAYEMKEVVPMNVRRERNAQLTNLSLKKKHVFNSKFLGDIRKVLVEGSSENGQYNGFTDNYIKVRFSSKRNITNEIINIKLDDISDDYNVNGEII
jgi:threonylcarbamoyladenosine tRNA methylthiotransferase MtaB